MADIEQATAAPGEKRDVRRVRIVSNGMGGPGTRVLGPDGEMLPGVTAATWTCEVGEVATAVVQFVNVEVDVVGDIEQATAAPGESRNVTRP